MNVLDIMCVVKRCRFFLLFVLCCAAFAACTDADDASFMERAEVQFISSLLGDEPVATRVYDTSWTGGEKVGVTMVADGKAYNGEDFAQYTAKSSGSSTDFTAVGDGLYYPLNPEQKVNFIAYSPYVSGATNTVTYSSMEKQSTKPLMESKDFIYHKGTTAYHRNTSGKVGLGFAHKLSKLVINVERATGVSESMKKLVVTVGSIPQSATCTLSDGSVTEIGDTKILEPWQNNDETITTDTKTRFEAIVAPHGAASRTVTFKVMNSSGALVHTYTKTISDEFVSGKRYIYNFKITPTGVALSGSSVSDWVTHTTTNDAYYLTVSDKLINVGCSITNGTFAIETNSSSTVTVKRSNSPDKITDSGVTWLTKFALTKGSTTNGVTPYTVTYSADAHTGSADRAAYLWIQVDNLTLIVKVLQSGRVALPANDANCYILAPGSKTVTIPVARAKYYSQVYDSNHPSLGADEAFTAEVLWSDQYSLISSVTVNKNGAEGSFVVTTNSGTTQGNAVVAIRNASGHILWSWHIWVTSPAPTAVAIGNEPKKFMDRNLGALNATPQHQGSLGLFYQWGRKDPFTGASVFTSGNTSPAPVQIYMNGSSSIKSNHPIVVHTNNISITSSIAQPHTFFAGYDDWAPASDDQTSPGKFGLRWGPASSSAKALDDPCPASYKVPTETQLGSGPVTVGPGTFNLGYSFNGNWWSAAGCLRTGYGLLSFVTDVGLYWSATRTGNGNAYDLEFDKIYVAEVNSNSKSFGFNVRCVSQ